MTLSIRDLSVRFGSTLAVDDVTLDVVEGDVLAVLGPSGSGKSTLLRAIAGLEAATAGTISYDGQDLAHLPTHKRGFALMFQDGQLFAHQSVAGNVAYPLRLRRLPRAEVLTRVSGLLELVGLGGYDERSPQTLSGGERQRVALARALAVEPRLLLLDEPLSALDRGLRERLAADLHDILRAAGTTAVMVTHDQEEAFAIADRLAVMREGRLVQTGTLDEVWGRPHDAWTARFLGYASVLDGAAARVLRDHVEPDGTWTEVALRRSAIKVADDGPFEATVLAARQAPEQTRLDLDVDGLGRLAGVADPSQGVRVGERLRVRVVPDRVAPVIGAAPHRP